MFKEQLEIESKKGKCLKFAYQFFEDSAALALTKISRACFKVLCSFCNISTFLNHKM